MKKIFKTQKTIIHIILGLILFTPIAFVLDFESLRWFEMILVNAVAGFCIGGIFEIIQAYLSGRNSTSKFMLFLYKYHFTSRNSKTKENFMDMALVGLGFIIASLIYFLIIQ